MTATLQSIHSEPRNSLYTRSLMNEFEFGDNRYPSLRPQSGSTQQSQSRPGTSNRSWTHQPATTAGSSDSRPPMLDSPRMPSPLQLTTEDQRPDSHLYTPSSRHNQRLLNNQTASYDQMQENHKNALSSSLPPGAARRTVELYNLDDGAPPSPSPYGPAQTFVENQSVQETVTVRNRPCTPTSARVNAGTPQGRASSPNPSLSRRSMVRNSQATPPPPPLPDGAQMLPLSASPTYAPPVAPNHRAYPQQPTYVTQPNASNPIQPVYTPIVPQQEEVCLECTMRDQDMADVDVTSPGVWERASDVVFEELKKREIEETATGIVSNDPKRPRIKGGRLTEKNLKIWLSINPREPTSKQQTLKTYIKSQRALLEAEAVAHSRAMQEAKQLDNRMRDAYSQLRRSAYDTGTATSPIDDLGGVRIKPPLSPITVSHNRVRSHSREVTLLENGMIVEHVDVRKEEKEAKEKRRKEERRARKSSRGSYLEAGSIISQSSGLVDAGLKPSSRFSQAYSVRPASVFSPSERPDIPRAYSQISFSDAQSLGSASPRRTRFFGAKNLSAGWRSQDSLAPSGMSGSMIDMHLVLQGDNYRGTRPSHPIDLNASSRSQIWPPVDLGDTNTSQVRIQDEKAKKKVGGLAKIWRKVTGKSEGQEKDASPTPGPHDDYPLAPPPPLSYLVDRKSQNDFNPPNGAVRHVSTNSLPSSVASPKFLQGQLTPGMSPPTAPSSILPSPASLRHSGDIEIADGRQTIYSEGPLQDDSSRQEETLGKFQGINWQSMQPLASETDLKQNVTNSGGVPTALIVNGDTGNIGTLRPKIMSREKSLPPIPVGEPPAHVLPSDRPKTFCELDSTPKLGSPDLAPPKAPFQNIEMRRQSFGGTSSRPNLALQTRPVTKPVDFDSKRSFGPHYDEFGISRRSLGRLDHIQENPWSIPPLPNTTGRRKSRFVLSSLLGKKDKREPEFDGGQLHPSLPYSAYDNQDDATTTGYATSISRHSVTTGTTNMRMSVYGRKPLEELVQQDPEFIAYRYPSGDQRLDLLR